MKTKLYLMAACVAAMTLATTGCSNEDLATTDNNKQPDRKGGIAVITAGTPQGGPSTRLTYTEGVEKYVVKWDAGAWSEAGGGEQFFAANYRSTTMLGYRLDKTSEATDATATFGIRCWKQFNSMFNPSTMEAGDEVHALYPVKAGADYGDKFHLNGNAAAVDVTLPLDGQEGTLSAMKNFDYMTARGTVSGSVSTVGSGEGLKLSFKHRVAFLLLKGLKIDGVTSGTVSQISISATGLKTSATLKIAQANSGDDPIELPTADGVITVKGAKNASGGNDGFTINPDGTLPDVYICFFPGNENASGTNQITDLKVTATVGSDTYTYNYANDATVTSKVTTFVAGNMYTLSGKTMTSSAYAWYTAPTTADTYTINNAAEFREFANIVNGTNLTAGVQQNDFSGKTILLASDVDLESAEWVSIGTLSFPFLGTFNGQNHKVENLKIDSSSDCQGLFGVIQSATIKNLTVKSGSVKGKQSVGGIVGVITGGSLVMNCINKATIEGTSNNIGGIVGLINGDVYACENLGAVSGTKNVAGIAGYYSSTGGSVVACINHASVTTSEVSAYGGGIMGSSKTLIACINEGAVTSTGNTPRIGGVTGMIGSADNKELYFVNNSSLKAAFYDYQGTNWATKGPSTHQQVNDAVTSMNTAITEWLASKTGYPVYHFKAATNTGTSLPTLEKQP